MGVSLNDAKLLVQIARKGISFRNTLTLARQQLFFRPADLVESLRAGRVSSDKIERFLADARDEGSAEPLFVALGAEKITSMDFSDYQGATIRHDLNSPVDTSHHGVYDFVFDGGTIEHVFNFPVAIRNAMEMVKVGGSFVSVTPANNQMGHGFYQFSPELFYNVLSSENGYRVDSMIALELSPANRWFSVANPAAIGSRVTLTNLWGVNLFVHAVREAKREIFAKTPQQSDYEALWEKDGSKREIAPVSGPSNSGSGLRGAMKKWFPIPLFAFASLFQLAASSAFGFRNSKFFKRVVG
jgi:SAM-dependent methyltransferase